MGNLNMLPLEMMLEILSRVPAEFLLECKSVSKPWKNLVQHPSFSQLHLNHLKGRGRAHNSGKSSFIFYNDTIHKFYYTEYDENLNRFTKTTRINLTPPFKYCYILGSCNGLICFNAWFNDRYAPAYICNPITREYVLLPKLIFEENPKFCLTGFGYCPSTNEYKVVRIYNRRRNPDSGIVEVFTLGSGIGWRYAGKMVNDYDVKYFVEAGAFVNGAIHWMDSQGTIIAFDLDGEELHKLPSPPSLTPPYVILRVVGDILCAVDSYTTGWDIWFLKKNKNNEDVIWTKEFCHMKGTPITLTKSGGLVCFDYTAGNFYLYTPDDSSSRMLENVDENFRYGGLHENTLVSLKALGEQDTKVMDSIS